MATVRDEIRKLKDVMVISFPTLVPMIKRVNINKTKNGLERSFERADNQNFTVLSIIPSLTAQLPTPNELHPLEPGSVRSMPVIWLYNLKTEHSAICLKALYKTLNLFLVN